MAKSLNKRTIDWFNNQYTKTFSDTYSKVRKSVFADLVIVKYGNSDNGTWMHEDLVIDFAQLSSVPFRVWCTQKPKAG